MKFIIKDIKEEEDKTVISVRVAPNQLCKTCGAKARRDGSSYCEECAKMYKTNHDKDSVDMLKVGFKTNYTNA